MEKKQIIKYLTIISLVIVFVDQITKLIVLGLYNGNEVVVIPEFFSIHKLENTGIAFSMNKGNLKNIFLTCVILVVVLRYIFKQYKYLNKYTLGSLCMIIGGGFGNLIDRIFRGAVIDFLSFLNFPVFNIADSFIFLGWAIFTYYIIKVEVRKKA